MTASKRIFWHKFWGWLRHLFNVFWLMIAAGYLLFMAGQEVYRNYQSRQATVELQQKFVNLERERDRLKALLVYYGTDSFKEKELRRTLLYKKPGETVYAVPESNEATAAEDEIALDTNSTPQSKADSSKQNAELPVWRQWIEYFDL